MFGVLAGGVAAFSVGSALETSESRHAADVFEQRTQSVVDSVNAEAQRYVDTLTNLAVSIGAQSDLSAADYAAITSAIPEQRLRGATGVSFVVAAEDDEISSVERMWRDKGQKDLRLAPVGKGIEHRFTVFSRSFDGSQGNPGRDLSQVPELNETLDLVRDSRKTTASRTYILLRDRNLPIEQQQLSFVIATSVVGGSGTPQDGVFEGWLLMAMRGRDFIETTLKEAAQSQINVALFDESTGTPVQVARLNAGERDQTLKSQDAEIVVAERPWSLMVEPTTSFDVGVRDYLTEVVTVIGVAMSVLAALLLLVLLDSRASALRKVDVATAALRADITRREQVEAELREREVELRSFAGVVAHDLRSPLTSISGFSALLMDGHGGSLHETACDFVSRIEKSAVRMQELIDDLLLYATARDAPLKLEPVDLEALANEVVHERVDHLSARPLITIEELPQVVADRVMLRQLLDNLIGNAIKYMPEGKHPKIDVRAESDDDDTCWKVIVADNGIGIPKEERASVFETFERAESGQGYSGTGLGLAICSRVVERHGGKIGVDENSGGGSRFWFTLPATTTIGSSEAPEIDLDR